MRLCSIEDCNHKHKGYGFCQNHLRRFKKFGDPLYIYPEMEKRFCSVNGCLTKHYGLGYCKRHFERFKKHGDPLYLKSKEPEKHGMSKSFEYKVWVGMIKRCYASSDKSYKNYGGRGIKVCDRWLHSFLAFYKDMGPRPFLKAQIDRRKNNEGYNKDNCRWVTNMENSHNKRTNVVNWFTVRSIRRLFSMKKYTRKDLCKIYKLKEATIKDIIYQRTWKEVI